jgi:hypothetical protein
MLPPRKPHTRSRSDATEGVRRKHHEAYKAGTNVVFLDSDVASLFTDSESVNTRVTLVAGSGEQAGSTEE